MKTLAVVIGFCALASCTQTDNYLLYGKSNVGADDAVGSVNQAIRTARGFGCKPISVGGGTGLAGRSGGVVVGGGEASGTFISIDQIPREFDVYVIVECPEGTPELLPASGGAVP